MGFIKWLLDDDRVRIGKRQRLHMHYRQNYRAQLVLLIIYLFVAGTLQASVSKAELADPTKRALQLSETLPNEALRERLQSCASGDFFPTVFSIAHRGAPLGYPEHSREGYIAAAEQGAAAVQMRLLSTVASRAEQNPQNRALL